jgi:hypothetical protein
MDGSMPTFEERGAFIRSTNELEDQIIELAGHLNAGNYRFLALLAEFDRRKGWNCRATRDCAHWLNWKCGIDLGAAREKVRTARALEKLPQISAAMERGEISYSNVRAITRVATPENEHYFLQIALHGTAHHVETLVRAYRRATEAEELSREQQQQRNRCVRYVWDVDGSLILKARLPADVGALVLKALEAAVPETPSPPSPDDIDRPSWAHKRADALAVIFESFMAHGAEAITGGERQQIVVHVSAETLNAGGGHHCGIEDGPAIAAETARRLACDASLVAIVEDDKGEPLSVGRKTRSIPPALQRALNARDKGCRFPGCTHKKYTDAHHIKHWARGGETKMSNLVTLCRFHHRKVHEGQVVVQMLDDGAIRFVQPDGESFESAHPMGDWRELTAVHEQAGIHINAKTAAPRLQVGAMDYGLAIDVLMSLPKGVSAETRNRMES